MDQKSFLQSSEWGQFQQSLSREVFWIGDVLVIRMPLKIGKSYLYSPRCRDVFSDKFFLSKLNKAKNGQDIFFRAEPQVENLKEKSFLASFKKIECSVQPAQTLILDLQHEEADLLASMHQKTRYNIRLASRHGVKIKKGQEYFDDFWRLLQKTAKRDKIKTFSKQYYQKQLINTDSFKNEIWVAEYKRKIIAANIVNFFGATATYLHGASSSKNRNVMAPYLLQWEQIKEAKKRGFEYYDFWGYDEQKWPGVSRFKKGFGGRVVYYAGTYDLIWQKPWYLAYNLVRKIFK